MKKANKILGIVLILLGIIIALKTFGILNVNIFFKGWWTLFIIVPSLFGIVKDDDKTGNLIGLIIGILLLLASREIISFRIIMQLVVPLILIGIGISIILKDSIKEKIENNIKDKEINEDNIYYATFSEQNINLTDNEINNLELNAIFGAIKCNLKESMINKDIIIKVSSIFGKTSISVPKDVKIKVISVPIFGSIDNKHKDFKQDNSKTIYINATCIFGGVDIR